MKTEESPIAGMPTYAEFHALAYSPGSYRCPIGGDVKAGNNVYFAKENK